MWEYKRTNKKYEGSRVYKAFLFGEFMGYRYKERNKKIVMYRDKQGKAQYKEVNNGWKYSPFIRSYKDNNGNIKFMEWEEFSKHFTTV